MVGGNQMTEYVATGNTFVGRAALKEAGFRWNAEKKEWTGDEAAHARWQKITEPTWGMTYRHGLSQYKIEERK
jgi:hypothetical protein